MKIYFYYLSRFHQRKYIVTLYSTTLVIVAITIATITIDCRCVTGGLYSRTNRNPISNFSQIYSVCGQLYKYQHKLHRILHLNPIYIYNIIMTTYYTK